MKVLLYNEGQKLISKSGIGKTLNHQIRALKNENIDITLDPNDKYDLAHINTVGPKSYFIARILRKCGIPVVYHAHSTEEDFRNSFIFSNQIAPLFKKWLIKCYTSGNVIVTPTPYSKKLLKSYGIKKPIFDISNGIDLKLFNKTPEKSDAFRKKFGFGNNDKVIMSVGLFLNRKGILDFIDMAKRMPEYKFIWFGHTPPAVVTADIRKAMKTDLPNLFFPGYVDSTTLASAYSGADLFFFPTHEETEGIVLLEALASKIPVLIRDIPIYSEWFEDGVDIYKASSNDEFEKRIKDILEKNLPDITENGYKQAQMRSLENTGKKLSRLYKEILKQTKK